MNSTIYEGQEDLISDDIFLRPVVYAGFWLRVAAYILDIIVIYAVIFIIALSVSSNSIVFEESANDAFWPAYLLLWIAIMCYFPIMESSKWQATLGKRVVGIIVTDLNGDRISFGKALARLISKLVSAMIVYIGFIMAGFTEKKQGLHDMIASTLVIKK